MILGGCSKEWFNEMKDLFEDKKKNSLWSYRKQE